MRLSVVEQVKRAAANNADLYGCVFVAHGLRFRRSASHFLAIDPPPPFYSRLVTLAPQSEADMAAQVQQLGQGRTRTVTIKDSFADIDLSGVGMTVLFDASWILSEARPDRLQRDGWIRISNADELAMWEEAWKTAGSATVQRMFPAPCIADESWCFWGRRFGDGFDAGFIANRSREVVGLSNVFGDADDASVFTDAAFLALDQHNDMPVVGYERGLALEQALSCGFERIGPLRVWIRKA